MKKLALAIGVSESVVIFSYGLSIVIRGTVDHSSVGSPLVQFIIYTILAASLAACTRGISKQQNWARTPYFLLQIFIGISGYTLFSGTFLVYKVAGVIVLVTGVTGFVALFRTPQGN
ncbi:MAG: hypothetical protein EBU96_00720 [Actinobacteria bacterium]|nr:hypothetical protein [Actinomycetota bacterium]